MRKLGLHNRSLGKRMMMMMMMIMTNMMMIERDRLDFFTLGAINIPSIFIKRNDCATNKTLNMVCFCPDFDSFTIILQIKFADLINMSQPIIACVTQSRGHV